MPPPPPFFPLRTGTDVRKMMFWMPACHPLSLHLQACNDLGDISFSSLTPQAHAPVSQNPFVDLVLGTWDSLLMRCAGS
jgi:hypothetical protein